MYFQFPLMILIIAPGPRRAPARVAGGGREHRARRAFQYWRYVALPILTPSILGAMILLFGNCVRRAGDGLPADRRDAQHHHARDQLADPRRRPPQPGLGLRGRHGHGRDHGHLDRALLGAPATLRAVAPRMIDERTRRRPRRAATDGAGASPSPKAARRERRRIGAPWAWLVFVLGALYFILPLVGTFDPLAPDPAGHLPRLPPGARRSRSSSVGLLYSFTVGVITIVVSLAIIVPTAYWVRLKVPRLAPGRRVRDAHAVRHPAGHPRLRTDPDLLEPAAAS